MLNNWHSYNAQYPFLMLKQWLDTPTGPDITQLLWTGIGASAASVLVWARARFFW